MHGSIYFIHKPRILGIGKKKKKKKTQNKDEMLIEDFLEFLTRFDFVGN